MNNDFFNFCLQQQGAGQRALDKPTFYRDFILDPQLNGPRSIGILPSMTRIGPDITFTRSSSATFINQEGSIQIVDNNIPRFDYEGHRTNLLSASNNFSSSAWLGYWTKAPEWRQDAIGPDNIPNSAWSLPLSAARYGSGPFANRQTGLIQVITPLLSGIPITVSGWFRADDNSAHSIVIGTSDDSFHNNITNTISTTWQRFTYTTYYNPGVNTGARGTQFVVTSGVNTNNNSKVYVYGLQCEIGTTATPYISTGASPRTVSRPKGLLIEEQRTNFVGQQNLFSWTQFFNTLSAGSGIIGLSSFIIGDENNTQYGQVSYSFPTALLSATTYCFSCYIKKNPAFNNTLPLLRVNFSPSGVAPQNFAGFYFNQATGQAVNAYTTTTSAISVQDFNTYYRASFTFNTQSSATITNIALIPSHGNSATLSGTSIEVAGIQVEQETFPTSYIPTFGTQATRTADNAVVDGSNFVNIYNNKEGTLFVEGQTKGQRNSLPALVSIDNNTANERMQIRRSTFDSIGNTNFGIAANNIPQVSFAETPGNWPESLIGDLALTYKINDTAATFNGQLINTNTVTMTALPKVNQLQIGNGPNSRHQNGYIRKVGYWPKRLSNTTLKALTLSSLALGKYFAEEASLYIGPGPGVEVTRTSSATYFASGGKLTTAFYNRPRFDYDPVTNVCKGLLIEEQRTNLFLYSGNPTNSYWSQTDANVVPSHISIDNNQTYAGIVTQTGNLGEFSKNHNPGGIRNITCSAFVKAISSADLFIIRMTGSGGVASFNIVNGTLVSVTSGGTIPTTVSANIQSIGNQWYRCSLTTVYSNPITNITTRMYCLTSSTNSRIGCSYYIWGIQQEDGLFPTSYIPTTNAQVTRTADTVQINPTNWQRIYNPEQGTFYTKVLPLSGSQAAAVIDVGDTYNSIHGIWKSGPGGDGSSGTSWNAFSYNDFLSAGAQLTPLTANFVSTAGVANSGSGIAYTYGFNNFNASVNGSLSTIITQSTAVSAIPVMTGFNHLNGHVQTLEYYPVQLTNAQLTALTIQ